MSVGPDTGASITSLVQTGTEVFAAAGPRIIRYVRGKEVSTCDDHFDRGELIG